MWHSLLTKCCCSSKSYLWCVFRSTLKLLVDPPHWPSWYCTLRVLSVPGILFIPFTLKKKKCLFEMKVGAQCWLWVPSTYGKKGVVGKQIVPVCLSKSLEVTSKTIYSSYPELTSKQGKPRKGKCSLYAICTCLWELKKQKFWLQGTRFFSYHNSLLKWEERCSAGWFL